jgi:hypothetical protein
MTEEAGVVLLVVASAEPALAELAKAVQVEVEQAEAA